MLIKKLKNLILISNNISRIFNILEILSKMQDSHLSIDEYILIFAKFLNKKEFIQDNYHLFRKIIKFIKPSHEDEENIDKLMCFIFQNNISSILTLEGAKILIPHLSFELLLHFCYGNQLLEKLKFLIKNDED